MNERTIRRFFTALRRAVRQVTLYPNGHPVTDEALHQAELACDDMIGLDGEADIFLLDDAFYLNRTILPHTSLEFGGLRAEMQSRGIESVTIYTGASMSEIGDLAAFIAGVAPDLPTDGTIVLNAAALSRDDFAAIPMSGLRRSYASTLDVLRSVSSASAAGGEFELGGVVWAVEGLLEHSISHSGASLLLATVKSHDEYTFFHSVNACILALTMGRLLGIDEEELKYIGVGALLHDIGKMAVSAKILQSPGRLAEEEWKQIKLHPQEGAQAILAAGGPGFEVAAAIAFEHHARFDGTGYPTVTRSGRPHPYSRLVSVADTYDAITTRRSYRRAETPNRALHVLLQGAETAWDPDMVRSFISMMGIYPPGSILEMSDRSIVVVTASSQGASGEIEVLACQAPDGTRLEPHQITVSTAAVVKQLLPSRCGIDPSEMLEASGLETAAG